jgi:hypothetical protein
MKMTNIEMGRKGGAAGKGDAKSRGNAAYYAELQRRSVLVRRARAELRKAKRQAEPTI